MSATKVRGRIYVEDTRLGGDGWTVTDAVTGGCMSFETRREAEQAATFVRAYLRRWGKLNWDSFPWGLEEAPVEPCNYN